MAAWEKLRGFFDRRLLGLPLWWWLIVLGYLPAYLHKQAGGSFPLSALAFFHGQPINYVKFSYPPLFALIYLPLALLPRYVREVLWYAVAVGCVTHSFILARDLAGRALGELKDNENLAFAIALALASRNILSLFENKSYDGLVLYALLLGFTALDRHREALAGLGIGAAVALKLTPVIFLSYLAIQRRFKVLVVAFLAIAMLSLLPDTLMGYGTHYISAYTQAVLRPMVLKNIPGGQTGTVETPSPVPWDRPFVLNQSIRGFLERAAYAGLFTRDKIPMLWLGSCLTLWLALLTVWWRTGPNSKLLIFDVGLGLLAALLISPMSSKNTFVALIPATVIFGRAAVSCFLSKRSSWFLGLTLLFCFVLSSRGILDKGEYPPLHVIGVLTWGTLLLFIVLSILAWRLSCGLATRGKESCPAMPEIS